MDFYEPTLLFRQNAIKRPDSMSLLSSYYSSDNDSAATLPYQHSNKSRSLWLLNHSNASDTMILNKACSLDRVNIKLNYWKIPDNSMDLTALATSSVHSAAPLLAISSAQAENNLFIYELDAVNHYLTHHTTITLPNIHSLAWVPKHKSRFLVSGNNKGYAHLVSVPLPLSYTGESKEEEECAEIVKRFNHRKHLKSVNKDPSIHTHASTCISELGFTANDNLVSIYDNTLFVWNINDCEASARPLPVGILVIPGIKSFDTAPPLVNDPFTLALCGSFGISLFDFRSRGHNVPNSSLYAQGASRQLSANKLKWCPTNEYVMASAHQDGVVRLWDLRKQDTFASLTGHKGKTITALEWNDNDIFTGASDGNIVHWDLTRGLESTDDIATNADKLHTCSMKEGVSSVSFDTNKNSMVDIATERQCGTLLPALNNNIVAMCRVRDLEGNDSDCKVVTIDGSSFLGLHSKIYDAVSNVSSEKQFYTIEDINLMLREELSNATLINSDEDLIEPLHIQRKDTVHSKAPTETESVRTDDFHFDLGFNLDDVVSLHSVDSEPSKSTSSSSPHSSSLNNDSNYTLSTVATVIESPPLTLQKESLLMFLDQGLEKICMDFNSTNCYTAI